jgi:diguanylate cyclase (GGDEF)-like protein
LGKDGNVITDRLFAEEVDNAGALRRRLALDLPSVDILRGLARLVARVFEAPAVTISFVDGERTWLEISSAPDAAEPPLCVASAPLSSKGSIAGFLALRDFAPRSLDFDRETLLAVFALHVARTYESRLEALREREIERYRLDVLKLAANDAPLQQIFDNLVECVEYSIEDSSCAISLLRDGSLYGASAGHAVPASYLAEIDGLRVGPAAGSCGTAAERRETVIVSDIAVDPLWSKYRHIAAAAGLGSCWSTPIRNSENVVLGTLAIYRRKPSEPTAAHLEFTHEAAHVAAIAIEASGTRSKLERMALHDSLTGLPNRTLFEDRMQQAIASARRTGRSVAVGLMDLNRFKFVNDSLGHAAGDLLLMDVANRLRAVVRPQDTVARMGGDEFLLLMADLEDRESARTIAERFVSALEPSFAPCGREIVVRGSMGISVYPDDARDAPHLLRQADMAMYAAKASGEEIAFYKDAPLAADLVAPRAADLERVEIERSPDGALGKRELELRYEPLVRVADGSVFAAEAIVRRRRPRLGGEASERVSASAEESGLSVELGTWVLEEACRFAARWQAAGGAGAVWVDVSARQLEGADFTSRVARALAAAQLMPAKLCLQVTETVVMRLSLKAAATLGELRRLGVSLAIDDFGSGSSSLNALKTLPIGAVKIGGELLGGVGIGENAADEAIVRAIFGVGETLGLAVVAQGIESQVQRDFVARSGFTLAQGALLSGALSEAELIGLS